MTESVWITAESFRMNAVNMDKVRELSLDDFDVSTLPLTTHRVGIHTYGCENGIEITDMFVARASLRNMIRKQTKKRM